MANPTCSLSVIIVCRCHLALQKRLPHPNGTTHSEHHPVMSFRAATQKIHNSLMDEFGDPSVDETGISEAIEPHGMDSPSSNAISAIELEEVSCDRKLAGAVDDSSGEAPDKPQQGESLVGFLYLMVMYLAHPSHIPCRGGADARGIGSRVIRIRLQFGKNPFLASRYLWHAKYMRRLSEIQVMTSTGRKKGSRPRNTSCRGNRDNII
jgi:hypothetical protein